MLFRLSIPRVLRDPKKLSMDVDALIKFITERIFYRRFLFFHFLEVYPKSMHGKDSLCAWVNEFFEAQRQTMHELLDVFAPRIIINQT